MQKLVLLAFLSAALTVLATPTPSFQKRFATLTSQYATETETNGYILENNLWGESDGTGSQESAVTSVSGDTVAWWTSYTWSGGTNDVKSYANIYLVTGLGAELSSITSIPTSWSWSYTSASSGLEADVSFDTFLSASSTPGTGATSASTYEVMVWLSRRGSIQPAGSALGNVTVSGTTWELWKGSVSNWVDFSFIPPDASTEYTSWSGDLKPFYEYLIENESVPSTNYLVQFQAGTEAFDGTAELTTSSYSAAIDT